MRFDRITMRTLLVVCSILNFESIVQIAVNLEIYLAFGDYCKMGNS